MDSFSFQTLALSTGYIHGGLNNSGQIVGTYTDSTGMTHASLDTAGTLSTVDYPYTVPTSAGGTGPGHNFSAASISNSGVVLGNMNSADGRNRGFLDNSGVFSDLYIGPQFSYN